MQLSVRYGKADCFTADVDPQRVVGVCSGPRGDAMLNPGEDLASQLDHPLDFPPLDRAVVPGDKVVIALDEAVPQQAGLVGPMVERLLRGRVEPSDITVLSPAPSGRFAPSNGHRRADPRGGLDASLRERVRWETAETESEPLSYLANTAGGNRVYLHRRLVDADVVLPVACLRDDPLLGCRGPNSVLYPGFADRDARRRFHKLTIAASQASAGQSQRQSAQDFTRQETDEVAWLLGIQFAVGVVPAQNGAIAHVLAGECRTVFEQGRRRAEETWRFSLPRRAAMVIAGIAQSQDVGPSAIATALHAAQQLVHRGGMIVLLSHASGKPGAGLRAVADASEPEQALARFGDEPPDDALSAQRIADAVSWARVYLLSGFEPDLVEDLFMVPLESAAEADRLLDRADSLVVLNAAHQVVTALEPEERP